MPRCLTSKELDYLWLLIKRNYSLVEEKKIEEARKIWRKGLESPMNPKERMMRRRLRKKAIQMAIDLNLLWMSEVLPSKGTEGDILAFVEEISRILTANVLISIKKGVLPLWLFSVLEKHEY